MTSLCCAETFQPKFNEVVAVVVDDDLLILNPMEEMKRQPGQGGQGLNDYTNKNPW